MPTPDYPKQDKEAGLAKVEVGGRQMTAYDPAIALQIVEKVAEGGTLSKICAKGTGMPTRITFLRWAVNNPDLAKALAVAFELSARSLEEEALDAARHISENPIDGTNVRAREVKLQQLRWSAERRDPKTYGNRGAISIRVPVQINTTMDLGSDGGSVTAEHPNIYTLTSKVTVSPTEAMADAKQNVPGEVIVEEKPIKRGGPRKQVLIPPGGPRKHSPFGKMMRDEDKKGSR